MANAVLLILNAVCVITKQKVFSRDPESWYRWYRHYRTNHIWLDKTRLRWQNHWKYYRKSKEILSYSDILDILISLSRFHFMLETISRIFKSDFLAKSGNLSTFRFFKKLKILWGGCKICWTFFWLTFLLNQFSKIPFFQKKIKIVDTMFAWRLHK